jgi:hypothetical protein
VRLFPLTPPTASVRLLGLAVDGFVVKRTCSLFPTKVHKTLAECLTLPRRPAVEDVREVVDRLEKLGADDLWPLPKPSEMLFIK